MKIMGSSWENLTIQLGLKGLTTNFPGFFSPQQEDQKIFPAKFPMDNETIKPKVRKFVLISDF